MRSIKSRSGHVIRLTTPTGEEKIEIIDKSGKNSIVIDTKNNTVTVSADADVAIAAKNGKLKLERQGRRDQLDQAERQGRGQHDHGRQGERQARAQGRDLNIN